MKASWNPNYEIIARLPPWKRLIYIARRDAFVRYELPVCAVICAALYFFK